MTVRLTKYVHACLLLETEDRSVLLDPGQMGFESGLFDISRLARLDAIAITHEHFDHFHLPFVQALVQKFPGVKIVSTPDVVRQLSEVSITASNEADDLIEILPWSHESMEPLSGGNTAQNIGVHIASLLTHPGDSYQADHSKDIFAMPLAGPWGAAIEGVRLAEKLQPKAVVPIHDWMWNEEWRQSMYDRCEAFFQSRGINFIRPTDGQAIELNLL